ncbi:rod-binding protein [Vibrio sp. ZSDZ34]|jgi:flagellar protein FlgJ|uniref:Rod-binding protein n=1 Tax=Vibrio gelatinilyticus TaxID=2893468 RepID=A0A9X1WCT9_9VIBR|nr:rod-binding protein [Vibrio gelatinilyticus]MCJ2378557.1 rod-binding protein [Vibrio gelatinilyticus]
MTIDGMNDQAKVNSVLYHDNAALTNIKHSSQQEGALETVAGQFEAMFLQMVLRQMRSSSDVLADEDSPFASQQQGVFRDMYDGQLAIEMAKKQNSGIADMLVKQLSPSHADVQFEPKSAQALSSANEPMPMTANLEGKSHDAQVSVNSAPLSVAYNNTPLQDAAFGAAFSQPLIRTTEQELL